MRRPRHATARPSRFILDSTEAVFQSTLEMKLRDVNNALKRTGSEGSLVVEWREDPWPGTAVIRTLTNGASGMIAEPMDNDSLICYLSGLQKGLDLRNPL